MKLFYLLVICVLFVAMTNAQLNKFVVPKQPSRNLPQLYGGGGGSRKQGFDVNLGVRQKVWESQNKRHSVDVHGGYSQHLGGKYGSSRPRFNGGVQYTYKFGK
ncbi:diptericin-D-like isoform 1-T2 [Cochliomyia hominivorax]